MARNGVPIALIQAIARHSSAAILGCIENEHVASVQQIAALASGPLSSTSHTLARCHSGPTVHRARPANRGGTGLGRVLRRQGSPPGTQSTRNLLAGVRVVHSGPLQSAPRGPAHERRYPLRMGLGTARPGHAYSRQSRSTCVGRLFFCRAAAERPKRPATQARQGPSLWPSRPTQRSPKAFGSLTPPGGRASLSPRLKWAAPGVGQFRWEGANRRTVPHGRCTVAGIFAALGKKVAAGCLAVALW